MSVRRLAALAMFALATPALVLANFAGTDVFIPSLGHGSGSASSQWYACIWVHNPNAEPVNVTFRLLLRDQANPSAQVYNETIPAGDTRRYDDALATLFGVTTRTFGAVRVTTPAGQPVIVNARSYNKPPGVDDMDTTGQFYAAIPASFAISPGQKTQLLGVYQTTPQNTSQYRYNYGFVETTGNSVTVQVTALDESGAPIGSKSYTLGGYQASQYNITDLLPSVSTTNVRLEVAVTAGPGQVVAFGSGTSNRANDPSTFEMSFRDQLLAANSSGATLTSVSHDGTLQGDGTAATPLSIAASGVSATKIASGQVAKSVNGLTDAVTLAAGANVSITPSGNTLTIAAPGGSGSGLPSGTAGQTLYHTGSAWAASSALTNDGTNVGVNGNLTLPATTSGGAAGVLLLGTDRFLHNYGPTDASNTFVGLQAGNFSMTGNRNTATGWYSLTSNTTGAANTAIGAKSLQNNTEGGGNTAVGRVSLMSNTTGNENTAIGDGSLSRNTEGGSNTAIGVGSLNSNTTGSSNTAIGKESLLNSTTGNSNIAIGRGSLNGNTDGAHNTAIGSGSLRGNTGGDGNTAIGDGALSSNTTGSANVAIGAAAGDNLTTGGWNIDIANEGVAGESGTTRIGNVQTNAYIAGIYGVVIASGSPVLADSSGHLGTVSSSLRFKRDVADMGDASSRLLELRPVTFHYKTQPDGRLQYGLIAEDVNEIMPELVVKDAAGQPETVAYHELPAMLLNELQRQHATIQAQQAKIEALVARLAALEARLADR